MHRCCIFVVISWEGINVTRSIAVRMTQQNLNTNYENVLCCYCHVGDFIIFCILNVFNRTIMTKKLTLEPNLSIPNVT